MHESVTMDESGLSLGADTETPRPGLALLYCSGEPMLGAVDLAHRELTVGRGSLSWIELRDSRLSKQHATFSLDGDAFVIRDHQSRNGTYLNGERVEGEVRHRGTGVVRMGDTVLRLEPNIGPLLEGVVEQRGEFLVGPRLAATLQQAARAGSTGILHVTGETGAGKELVAQHFHRAAAGRDGRLVAVNCAAIPETVAERLLFGARKGAYSGATADSAGYLQEADGGTLFLDEVGELDLSIQAKLLRVLETREVLPLGAGRPQKLTFQLCSATHRDLRQLVAEGKFREDLFYRMSRPRVSIPPLRERPEEVAFLVDKQLRRIDSAMTAHASFIEACLLRFWPGNVRELLAEVRDAGLLAQGDQRILVRASDLAADAGVAHEESTAALDAPRPDYFPTDDAIRSALEACEGKVATAARRLGIHRNQLRRWLDRQPAEEASPSPFKT